ncbi:putative siderophore biosynthesis protein, partial [Protomyces lactucae-debilis]
VVTNGRRHPQRPPKAYPGELIYARVIDINGSQCTLELKVASIKNDLKHFSEWHNSDRVNAFWGERGTAEQHKAYLKKQLVDPHVIPVIGHIDGTPFGYFEIYWAKEDNIAPFADSHDYDRGFHALVGDTPYRGPHVVSHWIASLTHYCFLADPRTMRVMLEPRADNDKFINYLNVSGYCREKDFNFPHKRAALMTISREHFFESHP